MMNRVCLFFILIISALPAFADIPYNGIWQKGNEFYGRQQYDSAIYYYEQLAARQPDHAEVYYNLGNAYYRLNQVGAAVLNYERALRLNPGHELAKDNLALTQSRISNRIVELPEIFFVQWWKALTRPSLSEVWSIVALVLFLVTLAMLFLRRWQAPSWLPVQLPIITALLFFGTLLMAYIASTHRLEHDRAVVMLQDAPIKEDPEAGKSLSLIPEGTVVRIENERSEWLRVVLPDGRSGWMHEEAIEKI